MIKKLKLILCILLIMSISFTSFAAVGANDGSAFVTKAEFDAFVNTFNEQMDDFEDALVSKIDGAIANYLDGLSREKISVLPSIINKVNVNDRTFWNNTAYNTDINNGDTFKIYAATFAVVSYSFYRKTIGDYQGYIRVNSYKWDIGAPSYKASDDANSDWKVYYRKIEKDGNTYLAPINRKTSVKPIHRVLAQGATVLRNKSTNEPKLPTTKAWIINSEVTSPGLNDISMTLWGSLPSVSVTHGTEFTDGTDQFDLYVYLPGGTYPAKHNRNWYGIVENDKYNFDSTTQLTKALYHDNRGTRVIKAGDPVTEYNRKDDTFTYKFYTQKLYSPNIYEWINYTASDVYGDIIYKINGLPLCTVEEDCAIRIPLNITNSVGKSTVAIMNDKFTSAAPSESQKANYAYFNPSAGDAVDISIEHHGKQKTTYWLKVLPNNAGATAIVKLDGDITQVVTD